MGIFFNFRKWIKSLEGKQIWEKKDLTSVGEKLFQFLFTLYVFILPIPHMPAIRNIALFSSLLLFIYLGFKGKLYFPSSLSQRWKLFLFFLIGGIFFSNLIGLALQQVDITGSLKQVWENLLEDVYIFWAILLFFNRPTRLKFLLRGFIYGFLFLTFFAFGNVIWSYFHFGWSQILNRLNRVSNFYWWAGYSRIGTIYLPILIGFLVEFWREFNRWEKWGLVVGGIIGIGLLLLYRSAGPAILTLSALALIGWLKVGPSRLITILGGIGMVGIIYFYDVHLTKERKIFNLSQYDLLHNPGSLDGRGGLWKGFLLLLDTPEKVVFGYGYGWKKFGIIGKKFRARFKMENNYESYKMFSGYGHANPHNTYIEVLMDGGVVGLTLFLIFIGVGGWLGIKIGRDRRVSSVLSIPYSNSAESTVASVSFPFPKSKLNKTDSKRDKRETIPTTDISYSLPSQAHTLSTASISFGEMGGKLIILPVLFSYITNSLLNGYWQENGGKWLFFIIGVAFILFSLSQSHLESEKRTLNNEQELKRKSGI